MGLPLRDAPLRRRPTPCILFVSICTKPSRLPPLTLHRGRLHKAHRLRLHQGAVPRLHLEAGPEGCTVTAVVEVRDVRVQAVQSLTAGQGAKLGQLCILRSGVLKSICLSIWSN